MKSTRQEKILEIISNENIETQEELIDALKREGFAATQATASRDIRQLKLLKVMVDGVYNCDPKKYPDAVKYDKLTFDEVVEKQLAVMDGTAATMCRENDIDIMVLSIENPMNIYDAVCGEPVGTLVTNKN